MNPFRSFAKWLAFRSAKFAGIPLRDPALVAMFGGNDSASGVDVTEDTALNYSAVWAAVTFYANSIGICMPVIRDEKHNPAKNLPAYILLSESPNAYMTPFVFRETLQSHVLLWGNAYAEIERAGTTPVALHILPPNQTAPEYDDDGTLYYQYTGTTAGDESRKIAAEDMLHIPGLSFDGVCGYSVVSRAREAIGLALAGESFGASYFGRGTTPGGYIKVKRDLEEEGKKNLRESWEHIHRGPSNSHRVAILDEDMDFTPFTVPNEDAQFLQTRSFQVVEIARWFNLPPHTLRELVQSTNNNIEQQSEDLLKFSLSPWLVKWEQEYERKLLTPAERQAYNVAHDVSRFLAMDKTTRYANYKAGREMGLLTIDDILLAEKLAPIGGEIGTSRLMPANTTPMGAPVKADALNVTAMLTIMQAVASNQLAADSAKAMMVAAFPSVDVASIDSMLAPYRKVK